MDRGSEDRDRLLGSSRASTEDLEAFPKPEDSNHPTSYLPTTSSYHSSPRSSMTEYKRRPHYSAHAPTRSSIRKSCCGLRSGLALLTVVLVSFCMGATLFPRESVFVTNWSQKPPTWTKPDGLRIVGLVFYGRPKFISILDCYLKRNLVVNGGMLDEVHFMANTDDSYDLQYLDTLINTTTAYRKIEIENLGFGGVWGHVTERETLYIKIDDDIVFIDDDAIPRIVETKLKYPIAFDIAANIINSPLTNWFHHRTQAVYPYLPELEPPNDFNGTLNKSSWRASELPPYTGPIPDIYELGEKHEGKDHFEPGQAGAPPFKNHRWLPLENTSANLLRTPIAQSEYNAWGRGWHSWAIGAQQHYSLFENIEKQEMDRYWFGNRDGIWNTQYERYNINFLAIWGRDVLPTDGDDEQEYSVDFPLEAKRPLLIDTHALVAHFSFGTQHKDMLETDLLARYRAYANEMVCAKDNQLRVMELHYA